MPFGAKMSQDVFQLRMDAILEQCPGVIGIHDDIVIFGTSNEDHDANLINLMNVCQKEGLVLNSKKLELRKERVPSLEPSTVQLACIQTPRRYRGS